MEKKTFSINEKDVEEFREYLMERENSRATIEKYLKDVRKFMEYAGTDESLDKEKLLQYKEWLVCNYTVSSANSMLAALNQFLIFMEAGRLRLKRIRVQRLDVLRTERELSRKEFQKLVRTARQYGKEQTAMIMETMCATGIRGERTEIFPCRKYTVRLDQSMEQREVPYCDPAGDPQEKTDLIYRKRKNPQRGDLPYSDRDDEGSVKYMERNEKSGGKSGDRTEKSIST